MRLILLLHIVHVLQAVKLEERMPWWGMWVNWRWAHQVTQELHEKDIWFLMLALRVVSINLLKKCHISKIMLNTSLFGVESHCYGQWWLQIITSSSAEFCGSNPHLRTANTLNSSICHYVWHTLCDRMVIAILFCSSCLLFVLHVIFQKPSYQ